MESLRENQLFGEKTEFEIHFSLVGRKVIFPATEFLFKLGFIYTHLIIDSNLKLYKKHYKNK